MQSFVNQLAENKQHNYCVYLHYPSQARRILYATNWIERLNKETRKVSRHVNSFPNPESALNMVFVVVTRLKDTAYANPDVSFYPYSEQANNVFNP